MDETVKRKRSVRDGTVDKADFFELLKDRHWHQLNSIILQLKGKVPPEIACQYFVRHRTGNRVRKGENDTEAAESAESSASHAEKVNRGRRVFVRKRLNDSVDHGFIRKRKSGQGDDDWEYQWAQWFCWSCGQASNDASDGTLHLCDKCRTTANAFNPGVTPLPDRVVALAQEVQAELKALREERDAAVRKLRTVFSATEG